MKSYKMFALFVLIALLLTACGGQGAVQSTDVVVDETATQEQAAGEATEATGGDAAEGETMVVKVATDATWPPFEIVDEASKEIIGFDIDLFNAIAEAEGLQLEFINIGFDPLLAGISNCQYDAAISAITITEERKASMLFSDPYINAGQIVVVAEDNTEINSKENLAGKVVGAQIATTGAIEVEAIEGAELKTYDTVDLAFLDLMNGQVQAVVADYPTAVSFVMKYDDQLKTVGEVFTDENYGVAVCKDNTELLDKINSGLAKIKEEGLIQELEAKWLSPAE